MRRTGPDKETPAGNFKTAGDALDIIRVMVGSDFECVTE